MRHDSVLCLRTGPDEVLRALYDISLVTGIFAVAICPAVVWHKVLGLAFILLLVVVLRRIKPGPPEGILWLYADGRVLWKIEGQKPETGVIGANSWLTGQYAVIKPLIGSRSVRLLLSRSRQDVGNYRLLAAWLRLKAWNRKSTV